jgi:L-amino acid N-acyltransferase YncA
MEQIRDAIESDLAEIVNIYNTSIPSRIATGDLQPISVESRLQWFYDHSPGHRPIWVMEINKEIAGWLGFQSFYYGRPAYNKTAEISLYISPNYQRRGIGKKLLQQAIDKSPSLDLNILLGFIFAHNKPSIELFTKHQFEKWGYLPKVAQLDDVERDLLILGRTIHQE